MTDAYSVLISVYAKENASFFELALKSMINQSIPPQEIVIVEDGPLTDSLYQTIEQLSDAHPALFHIVQLQKNQGLGLALQRGIHECHNELIARMDSDDISRPYRLEHQLQKFHERPDLSLCGGWISEFENDPEQCIGFRKCPETNDEIREYIRKRCPFNHMSVMFRKSEVLRAGNYRDFLYNEDYLLWIQMFKSGCVFYNLQEVLVDVRADSGLYARRGGKAYFDSEKGIQDILLKNKMISKAEYASNIAKRFILQRVCPNWLRGWIFRKFARSKD
jgi:glycosyltransferase involved in cell wall biosynthesis